MDDVIHMNVRGADFSQEFLSRKSVEKSVDFRNFVRTSVNTDARYTESANLEILVGG